MPAAAHQHHTTEQQQCELVQGPLPASQHLLPAPLANGGRKGNHTLPDQPYDRTAAHRLSALFVPYLRPLSTNTGAGRYQTMLYEIWSEALCRHTLINAFTCTHLAQRNRSGHQIRFFLCASIASIDTNRITVSAQANCRLFPPGSLEMGVYWCTC